VTQQPTDPSPSLSVLRIYLRRRGTKPGRGFWGRLFGRSLSYDLAERALKAGVTYATVTLGHAGFVPGAKRIVADISEVPPTTLPSCVELVAPVDALEAFVTANRDELADAVLLRLDGVRVTLRGTSA
jgi:PII-like signaling protein